MTNEQILKKAIEKAVKNGWESPLHYNEDTGNIEVNPWKTAEWYLECGHFRRYYELIFTHDFAKAFWGEERAYCGNCSFYKNSDYKEMCVNCNSTTYNWQIHLKDMVLEKEPLKYLERFL